jgi:hypothetical protein
LRSHDDVGLGGFHIGCPPTQFKNNQCGGKENDVASITWSWRHAILKSDLPPVTRHVLLTISCYMNEVGEGCYPSIATLVATTGLAKRSIITHIASAALGGWIEVSKHGFAGQQWKRSEYRAAWPKGGAGDAPRMPEGGERRARGGASDGKKVVQEMHPILPVNLPENLPGGKTPPALVGGAFVPVGKDEACDILGKLAKSLQVK